MYIIIRPECPAHNETLCLVQAESIEEAKRMSDVLPDHSSWIQIKDILLCGLSTVKRCVIEYEFPNV